MAKPKKRTQSASVDTTDQSSTTAVATPHDGNGGSNGYDRDRIAMRAYELWLQRGAADGGDFDDWLAAERELHGSSGDVSQGDDRE